MKTLLNILREGNVKVERNLMGVLEEIGRTLEDEYEDVKMNFEKSVTAEEDIEKIEKGEGKKKVVVKEDVDVTIVKDVKTFVQRVIEARGLDNETVKCRPVMDAGQGSFKVVLSVFDGNQDPDIAFAIQEGKFEKLTGVNRLLVLAEVDGGLERHHNLRKILAQPWNLEFSGHLEVWTHGCRSLNLVGLLRRTCRNTKMSSMNV